MRPVRALREEHGIVPRPANTEFRRHPAEGVLASCSPIFTCRDPEIATSPFVYRGSAISPPKKLGNLQGEAEKGAGAPAPERFSPSSFDTAFFANETMSDLSAESGFTLPVAGLCFNFHGLAAT